MRAGSICGVLTAGLLGLGAGGPAFADHHEERGAPGKPAPAAPNAAEEEAPEAAAEEAAKPVPEPVAKTAANPAVKKAPSEPAIEGDGVEAKYLRALHAKLHKRWAENFLVMAQHQLPKTHPVNDPGRRAVVEVVLTKEGRLVRVGLKESSGAGEFDSTAVDVIKDAAPFATAPEEVLSDDYNAHLEWALARNHRSCGELQWINKESAIEVAVPRLLEQGREREALRRLRALAAEGTPDPGLGVYARAWLRRAIADKKLALPAAAALANAGDDAGVTVLRDALKRGEQVAVVARALARLRVPICPLVKDRLAKAEGKALAVLALRYGAGGECVAPLVALAANPGTAISMRVAAVEALGTADEPEARKMIAELAEQAPAHVRAAAILGLARPNSGRAVLFKLTPMLREAIPAVRAAAFAGTVHAVGDAGLDQLYLIWKEKAPQAFEATAEALGRLSSAESADLLGKMLKRDDKRVRVAAAAALARRSDPHAAKHLATITGDPALRFYASAAMERGERSGMAASIGLAGRDPYRVLVSGAGRAVAAEWALANLEQLDAPSRAELLGEWLAGSPDVAAVARK